MTVSFGWGPVEARVLVPAAACVVVVDVLSFTTAVGVAVEGGTAVLPYRWKDATAAAYAREKDAVLAVGRREATGEHPWSLSRPPCAPPWGRRAWSCRPRTAPPSPRRPPRAVRGSWRPPAQPFGRGPAARRRGVRDGGPPARRHRLRRAVARRLAASGARRPAGRGSRALHPAGTHP
ncbi:hypothetical protein O1L60_32680 [Streptomyces diastatochromogenes]|nr:hypothetical protein [Streptomyces diastatochromogenes]